MCDIINYSKFLNSKLLIFVFFNFEVLTAKLLFAKFSFRSYWRIPLIALAAPVELYFGITCRTSKKL